MVDDVGNDNDLSDSHVGMIVGIRIERVLPGDAPVTNVEVDVSPSLVRDAPRVTFRFERAIEIEVSRLDGYLTSILAIRSIRNWGWERVNYAVTDDEGQLIALKCERWSRSDQYARAFAAAAPSTASRSPSPTSFA